MKGTLDSLSGGYQLLNMLQCFPKISINLFPLITFLAQTGGELDPMCSVGTAL